MEIISKDTTIQQLQARVGQLEHEAALQLRVDTTSEEEEDVTLAHAKSAKDSAEQKDKATKLLKYYTATKDAFGEDDARAVAAKKEHVAAEAEIAESKPLPERQKAAQKKVERLRKVLGKMEDLHAGAVADYVCIQTKANKIVIDVDEARANWAEAKERAQVARRPRRGEVG